jgi:hypothetical protein
VWLIYGCRVSGARMVVKFPALVLFGVSPLARFFVLCGVESATQSMRAHRGGKASSLRISPVGTTNLRIKTFVGTSSNALQIQIWTSPIALLLLKYLQLRARFGWSLSNLAALLRQQLFVYRDLMVWIDEPFQPPPLLDPAVEQLSLSW